MEAYVQEKLKTKVFKKTGTTSGCINEGGIYETDTGKVFLKCNSEPEANVMFQGEYESLKELLKTNTVKVPEPFLVGNVGKKFFLVMEYISMNSLKKYSSRLGELLAELHLHNIRALKNEKKSEGVVTRNRIHSTDKFGFHVPTACGYLPQNNEWSTDWVSFYTRQKLQLQVDMVLKNNGSRDVGELWAKLQYKIPQFFKDIDIQPSLLHGDMWIGNCGETDEEPISFDPASFYGHHEYDLAIAAMFGGFGKNFFDAYHRKIPKAKGFKHRHELYLLFHHLNHWNHFGSHKESSLQIMRSLVS